MMYRHNVDLKDIAVKLYNVELKAHGGDTAKADLFYLAQLGSHRLTMLFYDALDGAALFQVKIKLRQLVPDRAIRALWTDPGSKRLRVLAKVVLSVVVYYSDIVKDVLLVAHFRRTMFAPTSETGAVLAVAANPFAVAVFGVMVASIVVTELANLVVLCTSQVYRAWGWMAKVASVACIPVLPAIIG